jgi:mannosyltransferase
MRATSGILAVVAAGATWGLLPWLNKPVFPDEGASLFSARLEWTALLRHSRVVDLVLLPYYSLLHLWLQLFDNIEWARFLSLLAFGLTVFPVGHLGSRLGGKVCGALAALVAATNPLLVTAALSARPYALSALA